MYSSALPYAQSDPYEPNIDDVVPDASMENHDPFKFSHGLTGVDQQADYQFVHILIATALLPVILRLGFRVFVIAQSYGRRRSATISNEWHRPKGRSQPSFLGALKQHFFYAPARTTRVSEDIKRISQSNHAAPTRPQATVIIIYILSNFIYALAIPEQSQAPRVAQFRGRCGTLAVFNLIPTILFALRNNPLIWILHISYDTFNLFHRWAATLVVAQSIAHVIAFGRNAYHVTYNEQHGWHSIEWVLLHSLSYRWGLTACIAFVVLVVHSVGPLRHAFYETFLNVHRISVVIAIFGIYFHLAKHALPQLSWIYLIIMFLIVEPAIRLVRILFHNISWKQRTWTHVTLEALPGDATRVTVSLPRSWKARPGSHIHIYLPRLALWSSHPFSVAWSESSGYAQISSEKLPSHTEDLKMWVGPSTISCIVRARTGMTRSLYNLASSQDGHSVCLWGAVEGPYGVHYSLDSYGTVILFAAGVGITHQLSFVRHLLDGHNNNTITTRRILLVWCVTNTDTLHWVQPWLEEITSMPNFCEVVRVRLHVSRMTSVEVAEESHPEYLDMRVQRCDPQLVVDEEILAQVGAMVVSVCGAISFSASVREAVRRQVSRSTIDFVEEVFSY